MISTSSTLFLRPAPQLWDKKLEFQSFISLKTKTNLCDHFSEYKKHLPHWLFLCFFVDKKKEMVPLQVRYGTEWFLTIIFYHIKAARTELEDTLWLSLSLQYFQHLQKTEQHVLFWNGTLCTSREDVERDLQVGSGEFQVFCAGMITGRQRLVCHLCPRGRSTSTARDSRASTRWRDSA